MDGSTSSTGAQPLSGMILIKPIHMAQSSKSILMINGWCQFLEHVKLPNSVVMLLYCASYRVCGIIIQIEMRFLDPCNIVSWIQILLWVYVPWPNDLGSLVSSESTSSNCLELWVWHFKNEASSEVDILYLKVENTPHLCLYMLISASWTNSWCVVQLENIFKLIES